MAKYILFLPGGTMAGVFGAGVLTEFEKHNLYSKFEAVYGISAGAMNAAYFAAKSLGKASKAYWKYLPNGFIKRRRIPLALFHRFVLELLPWHIHSPAFNVMDMDFLMDVAKNKTPLDIKTLRTNPIDVYLKLINVDTGKLTYYNLKKAKDPYKVIEAATSCIPFSCCPVEIDGKRYVDGGIADPIGIREIIKRHPGKKIVVIANLNEDRHSRIIRNINKVTGASARISFSKNLSKYFATKEEALLDELKLLQKLDNVILVLRPEHLEVKTYTKDPVLLKKAYNEGRKIGREFVKKLK